MANFVALLGLFLFWTSALFMPLSLSRAVLNRGPVQVWAISSIFAFAMVFMGYTRAMMQGTPAEAFAWSVSWAMPVGLAVFARSHPAAVFRRFDFVVAFGAAFSFLAVAPFLPGALRRVAGLLW